MVGREASKTAAIAAYDRANVEIAKLKLLRAMLAEGGNPLSYDGAEAGMYFILEDAIETLWACFETLYQGAVEGDVLPFDTTANGAEV